MSKKLYANRDVLELKDHYLNHVSAMTAEGLHDKSEIAAELAWRDLQISALSREVERRREEVGVLETFNEQELNLLFAGMTVAGLVSNGGEPDHRTREILLLHRKEMLDLTSKLSELRKQLDDEKADGNDAPVACADCGVERSATDDTSKGGYADNSTVEKRALEAWNSRAPDQTKVEASDLVEEFKYAARYDYDDDGMSQTHSGRYVEYVHYAFLIGHVENLEQELNRAKKAACEHRNRAITAKEKADKYCKEAAQLKKEVNRLKRTADQWFNAFQEVQDWLFDKGLWNESHLDSKNPAKTLINGLKESLRGKSD